MDAMIVVFLCIMVLGLAFQWPFAMDLCRRNLEGAGMRTVAIVSLVYSVIIISLVFANRLRMSTGEALGLSSLPLVSVIVGALFFTSSLFFGIAISTTILVVYFLIQSGKFSFDQLTGLRNRSAFLNEFEKSMEREMEGSLCVIDLKDFKFFNQKFGQAVGDELLQTIATWLISEVGEKRAFRFGGDQFAVIRYHHDAEEAVKMTNVLRSRFDELWTIEGKSFSVEAWVILVFFPEHVKTSEDAVNAIAFTLDQAKKSPHGQLTVYDDKEMAKTKRRQDVAEALKRYMAQERPTLYFQPVFSIATGALYSAEALLRLNDPELGPISPVEFIPIAEQDGSIVELTYRIMKEVCSVWQELGKSAKSLQRIMVNLSSIHFSRPDMVQRTTDIISQGKVEPCRIGFEITESMVIESFDRVEQVMKALTGIGCNFYLDDYGTGYSNIEHLMKLPFETVKLDRSIIIHYADHPEVLESVVAMLKKIDKRIVAEGVESEDQMTILKKLRVDYVQGFLFAKPMPRKEFCNLVRSGIL